MREDGGKEEVESKGRESESTMTINGMVGHEQKELIPICWVEFP